jgi:hypothetical protein
MQLWLLVVDKTMIAAMFLPVEANEKLRNFWRTLFFYIQALRKTFHTVILPTLVSRYKCNYRLKNIQTITVRYNLWNLILIISHWNFNTLYPTVRNSVSPKLQIWPKWYTLSLCSTNWMYVESVSTSYMLQRNKTELKTILKFHSLCMCLHEVCRKVPELLPL